MAASLSQQMDLVTCRECVVTNETFSSPEAFYKHAASVHYSLNFSTLYIDDFFLNESKCKICPNVVPINSLKCYVEHFGVGHKLVQERCLP